MKQKTKTLMQERILLHEDMTSINNQRAFINGMEGRINNLIGVFNELDLQDVEFEATDIDKLSAYRMSALNFIKGKVIPTIKDPTIAGKKTTGEKVFEMMGITLSSFTPLYDQVTAYIQGELQRAASYQWQLEFNSSFFKVIDGLVTTNDEFLNAWCDRRCRIFVEGDSQMEIYNEVKCIADALNKLKIIGKPQLPTFEVLARSPRMYTSGWMGRLLDCNENGDFIVNHQLISQH